MRKSEIIRKGGDYGKLEQPWSIYRW
jgi:hypothetical protein